MKIEDDYYKDLVIEFGPLLEEAIRLEMQMGNTIAILDAKDKGVKTRDSGLKVTAKDLKNFKKKLELNIKDVTEDMSKRITNAILDNTAQRGSIRDLTKQISQIFKEDSPEHYNYKNRFKTIATTESTSILNISARNKAVSLGATKKYLMGVNDKRQGEDSKIALAKYGDEDKAIGINEPFVYRAGKKEYNYMLPPNRPNDREIVLYTFESSN